MTVERVEGKDKGTIMLYALSTCQWCRKTKELLKAMDIGYSYVYVDLLEGEEREKILSEITRISGTCSFPTLVIDGRKIIVGFREAEIKGAFV